MVYTSLCACRTKFEFSVATQFDVQAYLVCFHCELDLQMQDELSSTFLNAAGPSELALTAELPLTVLPGQKHVAAQEHPC